MMGGDILPQNAFAPKELLTPPKHEYVTAEATLLVAVLVVFYMAVILILFGVNVPCIHLRKGKLPARNYYDFRKSDRKLDDRPFDDLTETDENDDEQLLQTSKELQVVVVNSKKDKVVTMVTPTLEIQDQTSYEGVSIL